MYIMSEYEQTLEPLKKTEIWKVVVLNESK